MSQSYKNDCLRRLRVINKMISCLNYLRIFLKSSEIKPNIIFKKCIIEFPRSNSMKNIDSNFISDYYENSIVCLSYFIPWYEMISKMVLVKYLFNCNLYVL